MSADPSELTVILDNGSGMMKAGFAGEEAPQVVFPAIVGRPGPNFVPMTGVPVKDEYIGDEANKMRGVLNLTHPIKTGIVENWEDMEKVWHHTLYNELRVSPSEINGVLMTEAPRQPKANREKMTEMMFENFSVKQFYVAVQAVMSLYSAGRTTGLVVDSGDGVTHTVPVFEGFQIPPAVERMHIAGRELNDYCQRLLLESGISLVGSSAQMVVRDIKETLCYVAQNWAQEAADAKASSVNDSQYKMPDDTVVTIPGIVRIQTPELLFQPVLNGKNDMSMPDLAWSSVQKADLDIRSDLCKNFIMSGGSTMYEGIADRLKAELQKRAPPTADVRVIASPDRKFAVWKGASTLASLASFAQSWVTADEYKESGVAIIHRKCGSSS